MSDSTKESYHFATLAMTFKKNRSSALSSGHFREGAVVATALNDLDSKANPFSFTSSEWRVLLSISIKSSSYLFVPM